MTVRAGGIPAAGVGAEKLRFTGETMNCCPLLGGLPMVPSPPPWQPAMKQATNAAQPKRAAADIPAIDFLSHGIFASEYIDGS
jgi:hypothetical protein